METNEQQPQESQPDVPPEKKPIGERFGLSQEEVKELIDEASKITDLKQAEVSQLEVRYWQLQQSDPVKATEVLAELERRGKVPELLETEKREIETKRSRKTEQEIAKLRDKVRGEPKGVSENLSKMLKLKNVSLPSLFNTRTEHSKFLEDSVKKMRDANKKKEK